MIYRELIYKIRGCIFEVYNTLGKGLLESAYEAALFHELKLCGLDVKSQVQLPVIYKDLHIDNAFRIDLLVENAVIIEIKSVKELSEAHLKQLSNYLHLSHLTIGLLVNFNTDNLEDNIKSSVNSYRQFNEVKKN
ncbi:MAG: GxxExxY protein [Muribaculaceae bacterium]|nr:GxxExxY protein [Muribaculaceae bacterium]